MDAQVISALAVASNDYCSPVEFIFFSLSLSLSHDCGDECLSKHIKLSRFLFGIGRGAQLLRRCRYTTTRALVLASKGAWARAHL